MNLEEAREISQMGWPENQKAQRQHDAVDWLIYEVERLTSVLEDIANPIEYLRKEAEKDGCLLNSKAYAIAQDPALLMSLAKGALPIK